MPEYGTRKDGDPDRRTTLGRNHPNRSKKRIPIAAAQRVAEQYGYDQVVIIARKVGPQGIGGEHVTTYGVDKANCDVAARVGNTIKHKIMGWPEMELEERAQLVDALSEYGRHTNWCLNPYRPECQCGWNQARASLLPSKSA